MSEPTLVADHVDRALGNLTHEFDDAENVKAIVRAFVDEVQVAEELVLSLITERYISSAIGAQLDQYGALVGEPRNGLSDAQYRLFIQARIATNMSEGEIEVLISVLKTITGADSVKVMQAYPASLRAQYTVQGALSASLRTRIFNQLLSVTPAGVSLVVVEAEAASFGFDDDPDALGFDLGAWAEEI
jgi:hypothetical protein